MPPKLLNNYCKELTDFDLLHIWYFEETRGSLMLILQIL